MLYSYPSSTERRKQNFKNFFVEEYNSETKTRKNPYGKKKKSPKFWNFPEDYD